MRRATLEPNAYQYLVQRISVAMQQDNAASVLGCWAVNPVLWGTFDPVLFCFVLFCFALFFVVLVVFVLCICFICT